MSNGLNQLTILINKNYIEKKRNLRNCCCEYFSHLIIIILLVFGYNLSEVTHYDAKTYSSLNFTIPPPWFKNDQINFSPLASSLQDIFSGPIPIPNFDSFVLASRAISNAVGEEKVKSLATSSSYGQTYGNLLTLGDLHFAPDSEEVDSLIKYLNETTTSFRTLKVHKHKNEEKAVNYIQNHLGEYTWALIVVHTITPSDINYEIRLNYTTLPNTNEIVNWVSIGLDKDYQRYFFSGFLSLQSIIDDWAFKYVHDQILESSPIIDGNNNTFNTCQKPSPITMPFPTAAFDQNIFFLAVGFLLGLAMTMATMYPMSRLVKSVVEEKESKMREVMKIMGLHDWAHQCAWFINALILFFWIAISSTFVCHNSFLPNTDPFLLFLYFFTFCLSEITFSFLIASFFSKAKLAAMVAPVVLFASILPRFIFYSSNPYEQQQSKFFASLLSPTAFTFGADILANYEYAGMGVQTYNMNQGLYSFSDSIRMMFVDFIIYGVLAWYLDQVIPLDVGTPKHPFFIFQLSYWFPVWAQKEVTDFEFSQPIEYNISSNSDTSSIQYIPEQDRSKTQVLISHLRKRYPDGRLAVKDFSICFLEGQITCLLGHNGAGKTTTLSILTGLIEPTRGDCLIWGHQLSKHLPAIRQLTGICPQQNVLFPSLTVEEHLIIFGRIKGLTGEKLKEKVTQCIEDIGLTEKRHVLSSALSGGMKRKLCLAMALVGDPKFVLLDEPTSGMDPYSRRSTWELLQKCKTGRVIILTTHFMDEADILGDRIAIMSDGKLRCSGSPLFLKTRFGAGYVLSISRNQIHNKDNENHDSNLLHLIQNTIPEAKLASTVAGEVIFNLPITSAPLFGKLFQEINLKKTDFLISSYGVCITTLEQVFIQLAHENNHGNHNHHGNNPVNGNNEDDDSYDYNNFNNLLHHPSQFLVSLFGENKKSDRRIISPEEDKVPPQEVEMVQKDNYLIQNQPNKIDLNNSIAPSAQYIPVNTNDPHSIQLNHQDPQNIPTIQKKNDDFDEHQILGWNENQYFEKTWIQLTELLRKRFVIALRDGNGLFFQLVLPAIQIALILSILMINVNPAGHSLTLNAAMYPVHPTALLSQGKSPTLRELMLKNHLSDDRMTLYNTNSTTSLESSIYMLDTYSKPHGNRFGSYVFDDEIHTNITVEWNWVQENFDLILNNSNTIINVLDGLGFLPDNFDLKNLLSLNQTFDIDIPNIILNNLNISSNDGTVNITQVINNIVDNLFDNSTNIKFLNQTFDEEDIRDFLESLLIPQNSSSILNITNGKLDGEVHVQSIKFIDGKVTLIGVTVEVNGVTVIDVGNVTLTGDQLRLLLPNTTETYTFTIPSPYSILHNTSSPHSIGAFIGELNSAVFEQCSNVPNTNYKSKNHPLPLTAQESLEIQVVLSIFASLFILIPLCYIPASFVVFVVRERESKSKHLQIVSSVSPYLYWIATYIWDMSLFCILTGLIMVTLYSYGKDASKIFISTPEATFAVFLLLILYGTSAIPISYIYSFAFDNHSTAQISIMTINFFTGFVAVLAYYIMVSIPSTKSLGESLVHFFRIFPPYNIGEGLINIAANYFANELAEQNISYLSWKVSGRNIAHLGIETGVYMTVVLLSESTWLRRLGYFIERKVSELGKYEIPPNPNPLDEDIINETKLVEEYDKNKGDYMLVLKNIIKTYPPTLLWGQPKHAVRGINLACAAGERFGLLGINGAGKSTTLGILTGDIQPTHGEAYISGYPLSDPSTRNLIGYCPQTDPLLDLMTGYDTLWFFGRVRGLEEKYLHNRCLELIDEVGLTNHAYKPCGSYSGGNKRKLSLAVALIGNPKVLFLDEPSSGMDPEARRHMWEVITKVSSDRSVIITTHSMEECEAICSRISIMVSGRIQCIGSTQHLKSRFGTGYELNVSFLDEQKKIDFMQQIFKENNLFNEQNTILEEEQLNYVRYKLMITDSELSSTFEYLETMKSNHTILNYSLSQCTLEQIFINFAKFQEEEKKK